MGRFFSTISLCIFTSVLIGSLTSCSSELDQFEDDGWSNEEGPTTLATRSVGGSGDDWYGSNSSNLYTIPDEESECMLYALISIAKANKVVFKYSNEEYEIGVQGYSATAAYNYVKGLATCRSWPTCDVYGNIIEDGPYFNYSGGSMKPSVARTIGMEAGILKGYIEYFPSYKGLCDHLKDPKDHEHKKNTYIISREDGLHSTIGMGLSDKGNAKYYDKDTGTTTYSKKDREGDGYWLIIY